MSRLKAFLNAVIHGWILATKLYFAFRIVKPDQLQVSVTHTVDLDENPKS